MENRKTQDNAASRPSTRISRLAQPRKYSATPHNLVKYRSVSTENIAASSNRTTNKRSRSATPHNITETPYRLPVARSLAVAFTPASNSKNVSKKPTNEQSILVLEKLRKHFGGNFLPAGLHSMSAKIFYDIMRFFAESIFRGKVQIRENNADDVKHFAELMNYPVHMNKSWFKAPTVSTAYDRNVEFMIWLFDYISFDDDDSECIAEMVQNEDMVVDDLNVFSNQKCVASFIKEVKQSYVLWNDQIPAFAEFKMKLVDNFIAEKIQIDDVSARIDQLNGEYERLLSNQISVANDALLLTKKKKCEELLAEVNQEKAVVAEKLIEFQEIERELKDETVKNDKLRKTDHDLKVIVRNQPVSPEERQKIANDLEQQKHLVEEKESMVQSLQFLSVDAQVKIARIKKLKISKVFAFNTLVQKLLQKACDFGNISIDQLTIHENDTRDQIHHILKLFVNIKEIVDKRRDDLRGVTNETEIKLQSVIDELFKVEDEIVSRRKNLHSMEVQIRKIENEIVDGKYKSQQELHQLQSEIDGVLEKGEQYNFKIKNAEKVGEALKEETEKIGEGIEGKANAMLKLKQERQARRREAIMELQRTTEALKNVKKDSKNL